MSCPICHKPSAPAYKPFCSRRCAEIDLGLWLNDRYTLPAHPDEADEHQEES